MVFRSLMDLLDGRYVLDKVRGQFLNIRGIFFLWSVFMFVFVC